MSIYLEITQLENGDIVLREAEDKTGSPREQLDAPLRDLKHGITAKSPEPLVRISFSDEVKDMLGEDMVGVAEAMIDAATDYLGGETLEYEGEDLEGDSAPLTPVIH